MSQSHPAVLLLDTHGHRVHVSAASGWEIATKVRLGKLPAASELLDDLPQLIASQGFEPLPVTLAALQAFPCSLLW